MAKKRVKRSSVRPQGKVVPFADMRKFNHLVRVAASDSKPGRPRRGATASRMVEFADRVELALGKNNALPSRRSDRSLIGDLADLEWRVAVLWHGIHEVAKSRRQHGEPDEFDARLMMLYSALDSVGDIIRDLRGPLRRLVRARCGYEGLALAAIASASATVQGVKKPKR